MAKTTKIETPITKSPQVIVDLLKKNGFEKYDGGIQLFTNQLRDDYQVSINYMGTGLRIHGSEIDANELIEDDMIKICKTWECLI